MEKNQSPPKLVDTSEFFNIGLLGFTIALQLTASWFQILLYVFFLISMSAHYYGTLIRFKKTVQSKTFFILDLTRSLSLTFSLAFFGLAFSLNSFWHYALSVLLFDLYLAIIWSLWSVRNEN